MAPRPLTLVVSLPASAPPEERGPRSCRRGHRAAARRELGAAAVLSVVRAVQLLPVGEADARRWLHERGLVRDLEGRRVVIWGDVLDELRRCERTNESETPAAQRAEPRGGGRLPRVSLRPV